MKRIIIVISLLCAVAFFSCENEMKVSVIRGDSGLVGKVLINGELYKEYIYNASDLITEEKTKFIFISHSYNKNNELIESGIYIDPAMYSSNSAVVEASVQRKEWVNSYNTEKNLTQKFEYDQDRHLIKKSYFRPSVTTIEYSEFIWENDRIIRQILYFNNVQSGYVDYYYNAAGNLTKEAKCLLYQGSTTEFCTTTEYEYDNMKNPFQSISPLRMPGINTNPNNITKEIYTILSDNGSSVERVVTVLTAYEYNNKGYPVRVNGETEFIYR